MGIPRSACLAVLVLALNSQVLAQSIVGGRRWSSPLPTGDALNALWGDAQTVVAVGDAGTILRSTDHGETWAPVESGSTADLRAIWGSGPRNLWTVGGRGTILHSGDTGLHWQQAGSATVTGDLTGVWGVGANDIYLSSDAGQVVRTRDGGRSFQIQRPLGETDEQFTGVWGSAADDVYVVGERGSVLASADGGERWEIRQNQTPRVLAAGPNPPKGAVSIGGSRIYGVTGLGRGQLLVAPISWARTRKVNASGVSLGRLLDGGRTWKDVRIAPAQSRYAGYRAFFNRGDGVIYGITDFEAESPQSGPRPGLIVSSDGGATFERRSLFDVNAGWVKTLWRDPGGPLIAVGSGGTVLRSLDDGLTWQERGSHPLGRASLRSIWTDGAREVWIVGWKCVVLHSSDGGARFEAKGPTCPAGVDTDLSSIWASGPDDVYVTGGRTYHTTDRGKHWTDVTPTPSSAPNWRVWGSDPDDVFAVGNGIWRSIDRGRTWKLMRRAKPPGREDEFSDVLGFTRTDIYVVRSYGPFLHSSDGGASWEDCPLPSRFSGCCGLRTTGAPDLYAVGSHHAFFRSGDGAHSWQEVPAPLGPYTQFDAMIRHGDLLFVLAADAEDPGNHTTLLRSLDEGATWQMQATLPYASHGLAAIKGDLLIAGEGTVFRLVGAALPPHRTGR